MLHAITHQEHPMSTTFADDLVPHLPRLQRFARRLAGSRSAADDLVQETVLRALVHVDQFEPGTNLVGWLSTILRNCYFNSKRSGSRVVSLDAFATPPTRAVNASQESTVYMGDVTTRIAALPAVQRDALMLVGAEGYSYEDAADMAGCAIGTMKSRVSRARTELQSQLTATATRKAA
jgi:RNA polymerase sigma-70 factor (ECF subfamily)